MKTSNKLLIGLALAIITIPLSVMIIVAKTNKLPYSVYREMLEEEYATSNSKTTLLKTFKIRDFNTVSIVGNQRCHFSIALIPSKDYAFKISQVLTDFASHKVDNAGKLEISFRQIDFYETSTIYIFSPKIKKITFRDVWVDDFISDMDELNIELKAFSEFSFARGFQGKNVSITAPDSIPGKIVNLYGKFNNLNLDLNVASVNSDDFEANHLNINATNAKIEIVNKHETQKDIESIKLNTSGNVIIDLKNYNILQLSGSISDSTKTSFSKANLKQILKK